MSLSGYNVNPLMGYDWASLMSSPYFQTAWQTQNVNFRGKSAETGASTYTTGGVSGAQAVEGGIPVASSYASGESGGSSLSTLTAVGGLIALGGGAYYMIKKGKLGKAGEAVKSFFGGKSTEEAGKEALRKLTATTTKSGEVRYMIPGKTTEPMNEAAARNFTEEHCIQEAISLERQKFNPQTSAIETILCSSSTNNYTIKVENGIISSIKDKDGKEILKQLKDAATGSDEAKKFEAFEKIFNELKKEKDVDTSILEGVSFGYRNTNGDDVLRMTMAKYGDKPVFNEFITLQRFEPTSTEVRQYTYDSAESVLLNETLHQKKKLVDGTTADFPHVLDKDKGIVAYFEGENIVKFKDAEGTYPVGSAGYKEFKEKYEKDINNVIKDVFVKRKYIPNGATVRSV